MVESKFVVNDLVTADGRGIGRISAVRYITPVEIDRMGDARLAGDIFDPAWYYQINGGGFAASQWYKESTLFYARPDLY